MPYATFKDFVCKYTEAQTLRLLSSLEPEIDCNDIQLLRSAQADGFCDAGITITQEQAVIIEGTALETGAAFVAISTYPGGYRVTNPNDETSARSVIGVSTAAFVTSGPIVLQATENVENPGWAFTGNQLWVGLNGIITDVYPNLAFDVPIGSVINATTMLVDNDRVQQN